LFLLTNTRYYLCVEEAGCHIEPLFSFFFPSPFDIMWPLLIIVCESVDSLTFCFGCLLADFRFLDDESWMFKWQFVCFWICGLVKYNVMLLPIEKSWVRIPAPAYIMWCCYQLSYAYGNPWMVLVFYFCSFVFLNWINWLGNLFLNFDGTISYPVKVGEIKSSTI
jgi:hypothetical protein